MSAKTSSQAGLIRLGKSSHIIGSSALHIPWFETWEHMRNLKEIITEICEVINKGVCVFPIATKSDHTLSAHTYLTMLEA